MKFKLVPIDSIQRFDTHMHSVQHGPIEMKQFNLQWVFKIYISPYYLSN